MQGEGKKNSIRAAGRMLGMLMLLAVLLVSGCGQSASKESGSQPDRKAEAQNQSLSAERKESREESEKPVKDSAEGDEPEEKRINEILSQMSLKEKVDQLFVITPEKLTGVSVVVQAGDATAQALKEHPVGGLLYFSQSLNNPAQTQKMMADTQSCSRLGLLTAVDEEGGDVARVAEKLGTTAFSPMYHYRDQGVQTACGNAQVIASDIKSLGFNTDFAPVADVWSNPDNKVIGTRAFSNDFGQAAKLVSAAVKGFHAGGVICCLKHFPGHGDTNEDSHTSAAYTDKSAKELEEEEWSVFKAGIDAGADMVMVGHVTVKAVDDVPATISKKLVTKVLRRELGFDGVVITDSLIMGAVADLDSGQLCVQAVEAGADMLLEPESLDLAESALIQAVSDGQISEKRLDQSVRRILRMKLRHGIIE